MIGLRQMAAVWIASLVTNVGWPQVYVSHLGDVLNPSPRAENAKINVTDEPYFGTYILCNYLPFSKANKGAQGGPQQHETPKHSPTDISKRLRS